MGIEPDTAPGSRSLDDTKMQPIYVHHVSRFQSSFSASEVAVELNMTENAVYIASWQVIRRLCEELHGLLD